MRKGGGHLTGGRDAGCPRQFILQFLKAQIGLHAFQLLRDQSFVGVCQFECSICNTAFQALIQVTQGGFRILLLAEIAAHGCNVHRLSGARIVDPEAIDQEGYRHSRSKMSEVELSLPPPGAKHQRPDLALNRGTGLRRNEIQHVKPQGVVEGVKSHQLKTRRINILNLTVEGRDANEIGCPLHDRREPSFLRVSQPLLKGDRRLIGSGIQQQPFRSGWKGVAKTACGKCGVATEPDWGGRHVQAAAAGCVAKDKFLSAAEQRAFPLQHRAHMFEGFGRQLVVGQFADQLIALAGKCYENEIGVQYRAQCSDEAAADLAQVIIQPSSRERRERDQIADATSQLVGVCRRLRPRHCLRPELGSRCPDELDTCLAVLATPNWLSPHGDGVFALSLLPEALFEGVILVRSEMWWFSSTPRCRFSFGNADAGQRNPGWRVAQWKGIDQAFENFVVVGACDRFTVSQGPGIWPGFFNFDDAMPWTSSTSSGRSDHGWA